MTKFFAILISVLFLAGCDQPQEKSNDQNKNDQSKAERSKKIMGSGNLPMPTKDSPRLGGL